MEGSLFVIELNTSYIVGMSVLWCQAFYSPTLGVPVRADTILGPRGMPLSEHHRRCPHHQHNIFGPRRSPLEKLVARLAANPEEMIDAVLAAIAARDIEVGAQL